MSLSTPKPTVDSSLAGTYVASPIKFMIYGKGTVMKEKKQYELWID